MISDVCIGDVASLKCVWIGGGLLAATSNEHMIRLWHVEKDIAYELSLREYDLLEAEDEETVTCVAFNPLKRIIVAGTNLGRVIMFRRVNKGGGDMENNPENEWECLPPVTVNNAESVLDVDWASGSGILSIKTDSGISILNESELYCKYRDGYAVMQLSDKVCLSLSLSLSLSLCVCVSLLYK